MFLDIKKLFSLGWFKKSNPEKPHSLIASIGEDKKMEPTSANRFVMSDNKEILKHCPKREINEFPFPTQGN